jgi:hypothetical protein
MSLPFGLSLMAGYLLECEGLFTRWLRRATGYGRVIVSRGMRVIKVNTLLRVVYTLGLCLIWAHSVSAQTVLNFASATVNDRLNAGFAITNPTSNFADVQFTIYGFDGNPVSSGLVNPVRYRVAPKGQISMLASDLFAASKTDGWVQVTSSASTLSGYYLAGDFATALGGTESAPALTSQVIPVVRNDKTNTTDIVVLNPGTATATVTITLFNSRGDQAGATVSQTVAAHGALRLPSSAFGVNPTSETLSARVSATVPVAATAIVNRSGSLLFATGQRMDQAASVRVVPHYITGNGFDPVLVLTNPTPSQITVTVTVFGEKGAAVTQPRTFVIPANGSISADTLTITRQPFVPTINGWLRIDSPNSAVNGVLVLDGSQSLTSIPLEAVAQDRMIYSQISETADIYTGLVFVNTWAIAATLDISLVRSDGATIAQKSINIAQNSKYSNILREMIPETAGQTTGYLVIHSSLPIYAVGVLGANNGAFLASMAPAQPPDGFTPNSIVPLPKIKITDPGTNVQPGTMLHVSVDNPGSDVTFLLGDQVVPARQLVPYNAYLITIPAIEPGTVNLRVRTNGLESDPVTLHVSTPDNLPTQNIAGQAFYQKIDVTDAGLDLTHPIMVPIRNARVEVFSRSKQSVVAVSETDQNGHFDVPTPFDSDLAVRVISRLRDFALRVADNTNLNSMYSISRVVDSEGSDSSMLIVDTSRISGAFNILEMVQRANETIRIADPAIDPPAVTIYWSAKNTRRSGNIAQGFIGTSFFNVANNTAYILGDRSDDSDEFDDSIIVHEYGHLLAAKFSRDDSPGGETHVGDILDPRVAWSEGWANFFSSLVRNDSVWRDSSGPNGTSVYRFDLNDRVPAADTPGYWSETSVGTLLWELYQGSDLTRNTRSSFSQIWDAFTDLRADHLVYLPYFLEHFVAHNPSSVDAVQAVAQLRSIDFRANVKPSVTMPFPRPMTGNVASGYVDSAASRRTNLMQSSHYWSFTAPGGPVSIRMDLGGTTGRGYVSANDLDIFLMDVNGRVLEKSNKGLNGQSEFISARLSAGTYVVEVRSFYMKPENRNYVFNSGEYRLSVQFGLPPDTITLK